MGSSSSKNKQNKRSIRSNNKHSQQNQYPQQQQQQYPIVEPDYRKPEPEQIPQYFFYDQPHHIEDTPVRRESAIVTEDIFADIDSCIERLIHVGQNKNIGKTVCITQNEIIAICRYAYDVFLSQPVSPTFFLGGDMKK
jgi:hypothetical protein